MARYLYSELASTLDAWKRCTSATANESQKSHADKHEDYLESLVKNHMPSGSGFDSGTKLDFDRSHAGKLVFETSFHHMNENGYYDGWTEHTVIVVPTFDGVDIRIGGRNRNDIKEYMHQTFDQALRTDVEYERMAPARERLGIVMASRWLDQSRLVWDVTAPGCDVRTFAGDDPSETYQGSPLERARAYAVSLAWELARKR